MRGFEGTVLRAQRRQRAQRQHEGGVAAKPNFSRLSTAFLPLTGTLRPRTAQMPVSGNEPPKLAIPP
jgi:hypothetical protein